MIVMSIETGGRTPIARVEADFLQVVENRFVIEGGQVSPITNRRLVAIVDPVYGLRRVGVICTVQLPDDPLQRGIQADVIGDFNRRIIVSALACKTKEGVECSKSDEMGAIPYPTFTDHLSMLISEALDVSLTWRENQLSQV